jgi:alginate O-acetyltransferase complex protein AlgI
MLFNSLHFLLFLPVVVALFYLLPFRFRWVLIFVASCYFYMAFVPKYILILFVIIIIDYFSAILIESSKTQKKKKIFLVLSLLSNILLLAFFKYFNFLNENIASILNLAGADVHPFNLAILLPIGLSFHTFQSMSYTIEVYRGRQKAERHFGFFSNYVLFFPQMVAGPIERYEGLGNELKKDRQPLYSNFAHGFRLILFGLFIKMTIADNIAPYVNDVYANPSDFSTSEIWAAVLLFSFQIYADFYGYSTIALGSARLLGITIMDNFKTPYLSSSIGEFWSRWHISLSTWFRDYLYIPLGGNRVKFPRWCLNIMIVFMISGLWHGASWTFVAWGGLHGAMMLLERIFSKQFPSVSRSTILRPLLIIKTFIVTSLIWIFFRAENFGKAKDIFSSLFTFQEGKGQQPDLTLPVVFAVVMIIFDLLLYNNRFDMKLAAFKTIPRWAIYTVILFSLMALSGTQKFAFIYFQF